MCAARAGRSADLASDALRRLRAVAVPADAEPMAAYMKHVQPFLGVKKPLRVPIGRALAREYAPTSSAQLCAHVDALWAGAYRELRYLALDLLWRWRAHTTLNELDWLVGLVRSGAWWDLVDELALRPIGRLWELHRADVGRAADQWIRDDDLWVRRVALVAQNRHGQATDAARLFRYARTCGGEREFFVRKAIGWALREYAHAEPAAVRRFLAEHGDELAPLSRREAARHLREQA
jgi:3-methyladenine DNA glycosylase AlkD